MRVTAIARYPVKSMLGESLEAARLGGHGVVGDRTWALRDDRQFALAGGKRFAGVMSLAARFLREPDEQDRSPPVELVDERGASISSESSDVNAWLSARLAHPVSLWPLAEAELSDRHQRSAAMSHSSPPGTFFDASPLLILSSGALAELERQARASGFDARFDPRRFRANLFIDAGREGFVEDEWCGREIRIGNTRILIERRCPRCIMTTHGFAGLPRDPAIMRALVAVHDGDLGVYGRVVESGEIQVGDSVAVL